MLPCSLFYCLIQGLFYIFSKTFMTYIDNLTGFRKIRWPPPPQLSLPTTCAICSFLIISPLLAKSAWMAFLRNKYCWILIKPAKSKCQINEFNLLTGQIFLRSQLCYSNSWQVFQREWNFLGYLALPPNGQLNYFDNPTSSPDCKLTTH